MHLDEYENEISIQLLRFSYCRKDDTDTLIDFREN